MGKIHPGQHRGKNMTRRELQALLATEPKETLDLEVKIWLPGSKISLTKTPTMMRNGNLLMIEGNVDPGSALSS